MKEHPILFSGPMVRAIIEGRKKQTRRVVKIPEIVRDENGESEFTTIAGPDPNGEWHAWMTEYPEDGSVLLRCPYGQPGDLLWVRETWTPSPDGIIYRATESDAGSLGPDDENVWKPSIHMPRKYSRLSLRITDVRVQRVQEISYEDIRSEGWPIVENGNALTFPELWDSINAKRGYSWESNPWVWALTFEVAK